MVELMQSLDTPLNDEQVQIVGDLFYSHKWMLKYQGHVSMVLLTLVKFLNLNTFMVVLKASANLLHQAMLLEEVMTKLKSIQKVKKLPRSANIVAKIAPNSEEMKD